MMDVHKPYVDVICLIPELNELFAIVTGENARALQLDCAKSIQEVS